MFTTDFSKIDLAFVLDTTSSMCSYINHAKQNITKISEEIIKSEKCKSLRIALVNYRDHPPQDNTYVTQVHEFSDDKNTFKAFISNTSSCGGGDLPESVCCGLHDCLEKLSWRTDSVKISILIADAPPHGLGISFDSMPDGCPLKNDPVEVAHKMAEKGITLYCAGCEPSLNPYRQFFIALSLVTGGKYVSLNDVNNLTNVIIGGTREEISMERAMAQIHNDIMREAAENGERVDEEKLTKRVHELLNSKNDLTKINEINSRDQIIIDEHAKQMSKLKNLNEIKNYVKHNKISLGNVSLFTSASSFPTSFTPTLTRGLGKTRVKRRKLRKTSAPKAIRKNTRRAKATKKNTVKIVLRRSERIKEIERRKLDKALKSNNELKSAIRIKRKINSSADKENKRTRIESESTTLVTEIEEKFDINCARRLAKKVIARNFNKIDSL